MVVDALRGIDIDCVQIPLLRPPSESGNSMSSFVATQQASMENSQLLPSLQQLSISETPILKNSKHIISTLQKDPKFISTKRKDLEVESKSIQGISCNLQVADSHVGKQHELVAEGVPALNVVNHISLQSSLSKQIACSNDLVSDQKLLNEETPQASESLFRINPDDSTFKPFLGLEFGLSLFTEASNIHLAPFTFGSVSECANLFQDSFLVKLLSSMCLWRSRKYSSSIYRLSFLSTDLEPCLWVPSFFNSRY